MSREIKFRAWDKDNNKILNLTQIWWMDRDWLKDSNSEHTLRLGWVNERNFGYWRDCKPSQIAIMQFTGLKDKNGKEIYEGDIIQNVSDDGSRFSKFEIRWQQSQSGFIKEREDGISFTLEISRFYEVIGNIYENPELLAK